MNDPWFTSLWTLQEAYLRTDAEFLSVNGATVTSEIDDSRSFQLRDLILLFDRLLHSPQRQTFFIPYRNCGLEFLQSKNPLALLGISRHRTAYEAPDHILGIMQIFGLHLKADRSRPLLEQQKLLERQLCISINERSPVIAQAFTRLIERPRDFPTWAYYLGTPANIVDGRSYVDGNGVPVAPQDPTRLVPKDFWRIREERHNKRPRISFIGSGGATMQFNGWAGDLDDLKKFLGKSLSFPSPSRLPIRVEG